MARLFSFPQILNKPIKETTLLRLIFFALIVVIALTVGWKVHGYLADTPQSRSDSFSAVGIRCPGEVLILLKPHAFAHGDEYLSPTSPGYADAKRIAMTPHSYINLLCPQDLPENNF